MFPCMYVWYTWTKSYDVGAEVFVSRKQKPVHVFLCMVHASCVHGIVECTCTQSAK